MKSRVRPGADVTPIGGSPVLNLQRGVPGEERLLVYASGYLARVQEALAEVYEAIRHIVGAREFSALSRAYAQGYPSHDYNLNLIGRHLPEFLAGVALTQRLPFLPDLAKLEWLVCRAFHAFDRPPLDSSRLAPMPPDDWEHRRLVVQPSVSVVASAWPILDLWEARKQSRAEINTDVVNRPQRVLVSRRDLRVRCELIDERQAALLEDLLAGRTLGAVCRELAAHAGESPPPVSAWFSQWTQAGLFVGCEQ